MRNTHITIIFEDGSISIFVIEAQNALALAVDFACGGKTERIIMPNGKKLQRETITEITVQLPKAERSIRFVRLVFDFRARGE